MKSALKISIKKMPASEAAKAMEEETTEEGAGHNAEEESMEHDKMECEDAVATLMKAAEIKHNASLMKAIQPMLDKKKKAITSLDDLKAVAKEKTGGNRIESY